MQNAYLASLPRTRIAIDDAELRMAGFYIEATEVGGGYTHYCYVWPKFDVSTERGVSRGDIAYAIEDARRAFAELHAPTPEPAPPAEPKLISVAWPTGEHALMVNGFTFQNTDQGWRYQWRHYSGECLGPMVADRAAATEAAKAALASHQEGQDVMPGGRTRHDHVMGNLITGSARDINFKGALDDATVEQLQEALQYIPAGRPGDGAPERGQKNKRGVIEARIRRLEREAASAPTARALQVVADREEARANFLHTHSTEPDPIIRDLLYASHRSATFGQALESATLAQLETVLHQISPDADHWRYFKLGKRRETLLTAQTFAETPVPVEATSNIDIINRDIAAYEAQAQREADELIAEQAAPTMPDDLAALGFRLVFRRSIDGADTVGKDMWAAEHDSGNYRGNWHYDPADAIADAHEHSGSIPQPEPTITLTLKRSIAEKLHAAVKLYALREHMVMLEQIEIDEALTKALAQHSEKESSE